MWWKSFEQADRKTWEALVPGYNYFVAFKVSCNKPWWSLLLVFPGVHLVMWSVVNVSYIRKFGYFTLLDTFQGIFFPYIITAKIAQSNDKILPDTNWANSKQVGDREWGDHLVLFLGLPVIGHAIALGIAAVTRAKPGKKTKVKEWGDSIWFALVAALIIRTYVFEPFQIPTGSMEKTLMVGDFLFVNKLAYGPKVPVTPLSYPLVHNTVPWVNIKSYSTLETSEYTRLPGFGTISRNDVVVFNYPAGDTAIYDPRMPNGLMGHDYYGVLIREAKRLWREENPYYEKLRNLILDSISENTYLQTLSENKLRRLSNEVEQFTQNRIWEVNGQEFIENLDKWIAKARKMLAEDKIAYSPADGEIIEHYGLVYRPVDKRENYIKRCVGIPGDWIEIVNSVLYVNGKPSQKYEFQQLQYRVTGFTSENPLPTPDKMDEKYGLEARVNIYGDYFGDYVLTERDYIGENDTMMYLNESTLAKLKKDFPTLKFEVVIEAQYSDKDSIVPTVKQLVDNLEMFPKDLYINNTRTDFTKFQIPYKGQTIKINKDNIAWYRRIITAYEGHKLSERKDGIYIDGKKTDEYTFAMNYYWMMGDNRYNSADSRVWGFVPEDHIVGKASIVWFSKSPYKGLRTERFFTWIE